MYRNTYRRRIRKRYDILCDGSVIGSGLGNNAVEAIRNFARYHYIKIGVCKSFGECGYSYNVCKRYSRVYACGKVKKCSKITCIESNIGILYAYD